MIRTKQEYEMLKLKLNGWQAEIEEQRKRYLEKGFSEEEARRALAQNTLWCTTMEAEIKEFEQRNPDMAPRPS